jgi:hypothetical protein
MTLCSLSRSELGREGREGRRGGGSMLIDNYSARAVFVSSSALEAFWHRVDSSFLLYLNFFYFFLVTS